MKTFKILASFVFALALGIVGPVAALAAGPATVNLLSSANYVVLSKTAITTTPGVADTLITGDIGISPAAASALTGFGQTLDGSNTFSTSPLVIGKIWASDYTAPTPATIGTAISDMEAAYTDAATRTPGTGATNLNVGGGTLNGQNFVPGTYTWNGPTSNVTVTGDITLTGSASDIWIFQVAGTLDVDSGQKIILAGGALPQNVFWQVAGAVTLLPGSQFQGIILAQTSIAMQDGATLNGEALAQAGVTLIGNTISIGSSPVTPVTTTVHHGGVTVATPVVPLISLIKVPTPLALPAGPGKVTYSYSVNNIGGLQPLMDVSVVDDKCSPVVYVSGDTNNNNQLDSGELWKYSCTSMLTGTTTNTAIATAHSTDGYYNTAVATAVTTVVVGASTQPPLIHVETVPSQLAPLPFGGGNISYSYTVTNPGTVPVAGVTIADNKCSNITPVSVDQNGNGLLDPNEVWTYTCSTDIPASTASLVTAQGSANGLTAIAYAFTNVLVAVPALPNTGFAPQSATISWIDIGLILAIILLAAWIVVLKKRKVNN